MAAYMEAMTGEGILTAGAKWLNSLRGLTDTDREEALAEFALGATEALSKATEGKAVRAYQWTYGRGRVMKYFKDRVRIHKDESVSLDNNDRDGRTLKATMPAKAEQEDLSYLRGAVDTLPEIERDIVLRRFFNDERMESIAKDMGVTRAYVNVIEKRALARLRHRLSVAA